MEELYQAFQDNRIPWVTVNTAYLDQFFDVFLVEPEEEGQRGRGRTPAWEDCGIWFGEDRQFVRYGWVPLWNIEAIPFRSTRFMTPCPDGISYEHEFALDERKESDGLDYKKINAEICAGNAGKVKEEYEDKIGNQRNS